MSGALSASDNLSKGHITFLEERLTKRAEEANRYKVQSGRKPSEKSLSRSEATTMEEFLDHLYLVAAAMGYDIFESQTTDEATPEGVDLYSVTLENNVTATGYVAEEGFIVKAGSFAKAENTASLQAGYKARKEDLKKRKILFADGQRLRFTEDFTFRSSSEAVGIVAGTQRSGPQTWIRQSDQKSLRDVEAEQAEADKQALEAEQAAGDQDPTPEPAEVADAAAE